MPLPCNLKSLTRCATPLLAVAILTGCALLSAFAVRPDEPQPDSVGVIDGEAISVNGPLSVEAVHGQVKTMLRSGSDVRVKSGSARIELVESGQISICGPAHFSVLKSGGSLTLALEAGTIHARIERAPALTIYTPQIQAQPIAIGDGPQDLVVGFESPGEMCLRANRGAVRVEQQFTGQTVIIPQAGDVLLLNGQIESLRNGAGHCACELQSAKALPEPQQGAAQSAAEEDARAKTPTATRDPAPEVVVGPPSKEEPIYEVIMPPLVYDARAKAQPEVDPRLIVLVRRVRVRPTLIFQGRVEGEMEAAAKPAAEAPVASAAAAPAAKTGTPENDSFVARAWSFMRKLWSR